jgi:hypothetical protein
VIFLILKNQIIGLLETLKEWQEFKYKGIEVRRQDRADTVNPPQPTGIRIPESTEDLSLEAKMVLSTLWKHQQQYYTDHTKGRWSFTVGTANPRYADYCIGVGQTLKKGLVIISSQNGQSLLTDGGISFCQEHPNMILPNWDFEKWGLPQYGVTT